MNLNKKPQMGLFKISFAYRDKPLQLTDLPQQVQPS